MKVVEIFAKRQSEAELLREIRFNCHFTALELLNSWKTMQGNQPPFKRANWRPECLLEGIHQILAACGDDFRFRTTQDLDLWLKTRLEEHCHGQD